MTAADTADFTRWDFFVLFFFVLRNQCHKLLEGLVSLRFIQLFYKYILLETLQLGEWPDFHTA